MGAVGARGLAAMVSVTVKAKREGETWVIMDRIGRGMVEEEEKGKEELSRAAKGANRPCSPPPGATQAPIFGL